MTSDIVSKPGSTAIAVKLPDPRCSVAVRPASMTDAAFIDALQKMHSHMVGWMPGKQLEAYIAGGHVLVAETKVDKSTNQQVKIDQAVRPGSSDVDLSTCRLVDFAAQPLGYCIARDQYMKRDDVGIVYQLNVLPLKQRNLIGATLIKAVFERAAYGCRLFSCWCAQDIQANWFWESIGFIPLAFRTGSRAKQRIHIFWQRRVRENDEGPASGGTPYWFPSQTNAGAVGEDRIVLPIPPGTHWRDAKPLVLPGVPGVPRQEELGVRGQGLEGEQQKLPGGALVKPRPEQPKLSAAQKAAIHRSQSKHLAGVPLGKKALITASGFKYVDRTDYVPETDAPPELEATKPKSKRPRPRGPRMKNDPKYVAAAREVRDRFLEQVNTGSLQLASVGKYDVSRPRMLEGAAVVEGTRSIRALNDAEGATLPLPLPAREESQSLHRLEAPRLEALRRDWDGAA